MGAPSAKGRHQLPRPCRLLRLCWDGRTEVSPQGTAPHSYWAHHVCPHSKTPQQGMGRAGICCPDRNIQNVPMVLLEAAEPLPGAPNITRKAEIWWDHSSCRRKPILEDKSSPLEARAPNFARRNLHLAFCNPAVLSTSHLSTAVPMAQDWKQLGLWLSIETDGPIILAMTHLSFTLQSMTVAN